MTGQYMRERVGAVARVLRVMPSPPEKLEHEVTRPSGTVATARAISRTIVRICQILLSLTILTNVAIIFGSIVSRQVTGSNFYWANSVTEVLLACITYLGSITALYHGEHVSMQALSRVLPKRMQSEALAVQHLVVALFATLLGWQAVKLVSGPSLGVFPDIGWPIKSEYLPLAICSVGLGVLALSLFVEQCCDYIPWKGIAALAPAFVICWLAHSHLYSALSAGPAIVMLVVFGSCLLFGLPISFTLGISAVVGIFFIPGQSFGQLPLQMNDSVVSLSLVAVPFFVLVGALLSIKDVARRMIRLVVRLSSRLPGGDRVAAIVAMYLFAGLSGSKVADLAAVAPAFRREIVDGKPSTGVELSGVLGASAIMGETIPPSVAMLILGGIVAVSTSQLFAAGIIPAAFIGVCIGVTAVARALRSRGTKVNPPDAEERKTKWYKDIVDALPMVGAIVIIAGGIIGGYATPAEASSLAVVYALLVLLLLYRVSPRELIRHINLGARLAGMMTFVIASAGIFTYTLTVSGVTQEVVKVADLAGHSPTVFTLLSVLLLIVCGTVFEGLPALLIFLPLLFPQAVALGVNPLQYCIVCLLALGTGAFLPPLGVGYYLHCVLTGVRTNRALRPMLIYTAPIVVGILILALVPWFTVVLPELLHIS